MSYAGFTFGLDIKNKISLKFRLEKSPSVKKMGLGHKNNRENIITIHNWIEIKLITIRIKF